MRYAEFKQAVQDELRASPEGLTWKELKARRALPYDRPCPTWLGMLEQEIGLTRTRALGSAGLLWRLRPVRQPGSAVGQITIAEDFDEPLPISPSTPNAG
jgi:hypothetical protein